MKNIDAQIYFYLDRIGTFFSFSYRGLAQAINRLDEAWSRIHSINLLELTVVSATRKCHPSLTALGIFRVLPVD